MGTNLTAVGWGTTSFAGQASTVLKKAQLTVITNAQCAQTMEGIDVTKICTDGRKYENLKNKFLRFFNLISPTEPPIPVAKIAEAACIITKIVTLRSPLLITVSTVPLPTHR